MFLMIKTAKVFTALTGLGIANNVIPKKLLLNIILLLFCNAPEL